ncbi:MAG: DNA repair protein RadA, partial [Acetobacteraceae bacterium]|nr:DNA repair protein RadA [Acetobacteraceae bacterium]
MAKSVTRYVCQSCGAMAPKWAGRCETCGEWNTITEEMVEARPGAGAKALSGRKINFVGLEGATAPPPRLVTDIAELDRVLGGGFVPASAVLVGGDPGIGKSTLLLQASTAMARAGRRVIYVSGEESVDQVRLRARRLGLVDAKLELAAAINLREIIASLEAAHDAALVVIDSIQTMWLDTIESAPGTVSQVRACSFELIRTAKSKNFSVVLVGHVTKEGALAGPRVLEHMVDAVLYFEGDRGHQFRILRATKNRFGATDEIGVFEMTDAGLAEVANPSALFLAERRGNISGSAVFAGLEGTRPVLVEVQALLAPNPGGSPRRSVVGWDSGRLSMLLAVLETRCGLRLNAND